MSKQYRTYALTSRSYSILTVNEVLLFESDLASGYRHQSSLPSPMASAIWASLILQNNFSYDLATGDTLSPALSRLVCKMVDSVPLGQGVGLNNFLLTQRV